MLESTDGVVDPAVGRKSMGPRDAVDNIGDTTHRTDNTKVRTARVQSKTLSYNPNDISLARIDALDFTINLIVHVFDAI